jgi:hypothetical protein
MDAFLDDAERERRRRAANLARRVKLLRYHASMRGPDGKSITARRGGLARMGNDPALARATATAMALRRWHAANGPKAPPPALRKGRGHLSRKGERGKAGEGSQECH